MAKAYRRMSLASTGSPVYVPVSFPMCFFQSSFSNKDSFKIHPPPSDIHSFPSRESDAVPLFVSGILEAGGGLLLESSPGTSPSHAPPAGRSSVIGLAPASTAPEGTHSILSRFRRQTSRKDPRKDSSISL